MTEIEPSLCVFRYQLEKHASERPDAVFVRFEDGPTWTYAQALEIARTSASGLARLGVKPKDSVFLWMPASPDYVRVMFGAHYMGAIIASPNTAYKGGVLQNIIQLTSARIAVVHASLFDRLTGLDLGALRTIVMAGEVQGEAPGIDILPIENLISGPIDAAAIDVCVRPWDVQYIIYTSGTTGPSKGVIVSYIQMLTNVERVFEGWYGPDDSWFVQLPMYHLSGTMPFAAAMRFGAGVVVAKPFSASTFWEAIDRYKPTFATVLGAMATLLAARPAEAGDADNSLKRMVIVPNIADARAFGQRFGVRTMTWYGSSEVPIPLQSEWDPENAASCGVLGDMFEARIVDEHDFDVADGANGELIIRSSRPWTITTGYWRNPEATAQAWRNGWFHTGDEFRRDEDGRYYFIDRRKDAIRRRGENISSFEVENDVASHPEVSDVAAIGVPNPLGEEDVLIVVARKAESTLTELALFEFLRPKMPYFMLPRFIRFVPSLPKTDTGRVQKFALRDEGVKPGTWDREAVGIKITRDKI